MTDLELRSPSLLLVTVVVLSSLAGCRPPQETEARLTALEEEVATLRQQLEELARTPPPPSAASGTPSAASDAATQAVAATKSPFVDFVFDVTPKDADIEVDGEPVQGNRWRTKRDSGFHTVKVSRTGFRTLVQQVSSREAQRMVYRLVRGRGVAHVPPR